MVVVDAGRPAGIGPKARAQRSPIDGTIRSFTLRTKTPSPTPIGQAERCQPKPNGSSPPAAGSTVRRSRGVTTSAPTVGSWPTPGTAPTSLGAAPARADSPEPPRSVRSPPTDTACSTWPATCGSGRRTTGRANTPKTPTNPAAFRSTHAAATSNTAIDPAQPQFPIARRVIKGGSHLCADTYCLSYRPAARRPQMVDTGMSHLGFRIVEATVKPIVKSQRSQSRRIQPGHARAGSTAADAVSR